MRTVAPLAREFGAAVAGISAFGGFGGFGASSGAAMLAMPAIIVSGSHMSEFFLH
jgi:hypothetical protein